MSAPEFDEGRLRFRFEQHVRAFQYDELAFYRNQFISVAGGNKAVDFVCADGSTVYLIEMKDYSQHPRVKPSELPEEIALKVRDTLAGILACASNANEDEERQEATDCIRAARNGGDLRVILHIEQARTRSRLNPHVFKPRDLEQKLKQLLKAVDPHPKVTSRDHQPQKYPWSVSPLPGGR